MTDITDAGRAAFADLAGRYGVSPSAVEAMARAVARGGGTMAQFSIPELGGSGQWMAGGMTMVGDMFNTGLQNTVANLCGEISRGMSYAVWFQAPATTMGGMGGMGGAWWPSELGQPAATGGQNALRYAYFPQARRVAVDRGDGSPIVVLDSGDHQIGGWGQQQSGFGDPYSGVSFSSQFGQFALSSLPMAGARQPEPAAPPPPSPPQSPAQSPAPSPPRADVSSPMGGSGDATAIFDAIERLAALKASGALSEAEFSAKKAELLARL